VPATAEIVIIGSGSFGSSLAYHLAAAGQTDVVLVEKFEIASQTSPRAAGLTQQIRSSKNLARMAMLAVRKITRFAEETGEPMAYFQSGSVKMARTARDAAQLRAEIAHGTEIGLEIREIDAADLAELAPYAKPAGVEMLWFTPSDVFLEPVQLPRGYAAAAAKRGATIRTGTAVTRILRDGDRVTGVETTNGTIHAPVVVDAAGAWARGIAAEAGIHVPVVPVRHQLMITAPIPGVLPSMPICRVVDTNVYVRPDKGGLMLGGYEDAPWPFDLAGQPETFQVTDLELDLDVLRKLASTVQEIFPAFQTTPVAEHRGGLPTMTIDGKQIVGPVPNAPGLFVASGCCVGGLSISPAIGQLLSELILTGQSSLPLGELAIDRFGPGLDDPDRLRELAVACYAGMYRSGWDA
jgi:4-methylaminobutanoate oxidase (formaldehyde-forming)